MACLGAGDARAQAEGTRDEAPPAMILIAAPGLTDPNFARSVVLAARTGTGEIIGLILNRPTGAAWPRGVRPQAAEGSRKMNFGGPLIPQATFAVGTAESAVPETADLGAGLRFAIGLKATLALAQAGAPAGALKLFNGYAGWAPRQLDSEIAEGIWQVRPVSAALVFDPEPQTQWERLTEKERAVRAPANAPPYRLGLVFMNSMRSIDCTLMSLTSLPCSTLSGTGVPARPMPQSFW